MENNLLKEVWPKVVYALQETAFPGRAGKKSKVTIEEMENFIELSAHFSANIMAFCISCALKNLTEDEDKASLIELILKGLIQHITEIINAPVKIITSSENQSSSLKDSIN